jgi:DNA-binding CsgD family transcriptional regulator
MSGVRQEATVYRLRRTLLDARRGEAPAAMLDCGAHMLLYFDEPSIMLGVGLQHLLERFDATRVNLGFGSQYGPEHQISAEQRRTDCDVPDSVGVVGPNRDRALQYVWHSKRTLYADVLHDPIMNGLLPTLQPLRTRAKMLRRLEYESRSFGIVCVDQTEECRRWSETDLDYLDQFVVDFLSPVMAESRSCRAGGGAPLTAAERAVVRLAAEGLSYKEIAAELHKSPNTVDNQLRRIRERLGVRNQIELVRACTNLL